ncbi:MAG: hypothetical protein JNL05_12945 [Flavobacteriales bacterium]|nr:hypothetical protein [Flavobacteriales bacterium]
MENAHRAAASDARARATFVLVGAAHAMGSTIYSLYTRPHIRKYLMVRWAPGEQLADPDVQQGLKAFSEVLRMPILSAVIDEEVKPKPCNQLHLRVGPPTGQPPGKVMIGRFNYMAERLYREHFGAWCTYALQYTPRTVRQVVNDWHQRYGITDNDLPERTAEQSFWRYRQRNGLVLPHGGSRWRGMAAAHPSV